MALKREEVAKYYKRAFVCTYILLSSTVENNLGCHCGSGG